MEILDEHIPDENQTHLGHPIFLKRILIFGQVTRVLSFILIIPCISFNLLMIEFINHTQILLMYVFYNVLTILAIFYLYHTSKCIIAYHNENQNLSKLDKGIHHFIRFWIVLICFMILFFLNYFQ